MTTQKPEHVMILTYGMAGSGKTTDCGYSFPNGLFIAVRGALLSITHTCGYTPASVEADTIDDATKIIRSLVDKGGKYDAIIIDDFSYLSERTVNKWEKKLSGFTLWKKINDVTLNFREAARYANAHIILNCWAQEPKLKGDGTLLRGGPKLTGNLVEAIPSLCDVVLKCGLEQGRKPWAGTYVCEPSSRYVMKDRLAKCYALSPAPMNLAEILRASDYKISRLKDLSWQEEVVEKLSHDLDKCSDISATATQFLDQLTSKGIDPRAARWTVRDALDRMIIRRVLSTQNTTFV